MENRSIFETIRATRQYESLFSVVMCELDNLIDDDLIDQRQADSLILDLAAGLDEYDFELISKPFKQILKLKKGSKNA